MDRLEEFIRNNRDGLDKLNPSPRIWNRIRKKIKNRNSFLYRKIAVAAILIIIPCTTFLLLRSPETETSPGITPGKGFARDQQLREMEIYYNGIINSLYSEARPLLTAHPDLNEELSDDIVHLDSIFYDIRKDLKDNAANQEVLTALVQNYRIRIRILEDMLATLREDDNTPDNTTSHEL
ncbi:MAG TPA: hypothetical protein VHO46_02310 [Bacteroidales bacterium]|nr:hypothetical protein [Bacteroidales bacterium]